MCTNGNNVSLFHWIAGEDYQKPLSRKPTTVVKSITESLGEGHNMCQGNAKLNYKVAVFSSSEYVEDFLRSKLESQFEKVTFLQAKLDLQTAHLADGHDAVCLFVNDICGAPVLERLAAGGVKFIAMRCAGYDRVDLQAAKERGFKIARVPTYSPRTVAEGALSLMMAIARNIRSAVLKVAVGNYTLNGLVGTQLSGKTFGIVGTGAIGIELVKLLRGFDGRILAHDIRESEEAIKHGAEYVDLDTLLRESDIVSLHTPLLPSTRHIINKEKLLLMKDDAILINVSRGGLIDTDALMHVLQYGDDGQQNSGGKLRGVALDVYEREDSLFFEDFTKMKAADRMKMWDSKFVLLKSLPQVIITPHTAFLTEEALDNIGDTTVQNLVAAATGQELQYEVKAN